MNAIQHLHRLTYRACEHHWNDHQCVEVKYNRKREVKYHNWWDMRYATIAISQELLDNWGVKWLDRQIEIYPLQLQADIIGYDPHHWCWYVTNIHAL